MMSAEDLLGPNWQGRLQNIITIGEFQRLTGSSEKNNYEIGMYVARYFASCGEPSPIAHLSEALRNDEDLMTIAMSYGDNLQYAGTHLKDDKTLVMTAVQHAGDALEYASARLRGDREVVAAAVRQWPFSLEFSSENLRCDKAICSLAVQGSGFALKFVSHVMKEYDYHDVVIEAMKQCTQSFMFAGPQALNNATFMAYIFNRFPDAKSIRLQNHHHQTAHLA